MAGGLFALLDDVAALVRLAAASVDDVALAAGRASAKAAGVVIDDTAVTPQYLTGIDPKRELPIIKRIAVGSLRNKLLFILPALLLLSQFASWALVPLLMLGGTYLCYEGAHKVWEKFTGHHPEKDKPVVLKRGEDAEEKVVRGAITTDFVLSAEIMVISLNEVAQAPAATWGDFALRVAVLIVVALGITLLVYGVVALIVKMDDVGLAMAAKDNPGTKKFGEGLVKAMPKVLAVITVIGTFAMLWVGGHIILQGLYNLGWHAPYDLVHALEKPVEGIPVVGGLLAWIVDTICSLIVGVIWGFITLGIISVLPFGKKHRADDDLTETAEAEAEAHATAEALPHPVDEAGVRTEDAAPPSA